MSRLSFRARAPNNRTITVSGEERPLYERHLIKLDGPAQPEDVIEKTINQDLFEVSPWLPDEFVDLLFLDPPYNLTKVFGSASFARRTDSEYADWLDSCLSAIVHTLKPSASAYICGDWRSCSAVHSVAAKYFRVRNRITWEREKGRGARANWKSASEDIWFCTASDEYYFNVDAVKLKRRVLAPYTTGGMPKDWAPSDEGDFRLTHPSNLWTDLTVPFWSMPENTEHPTQKPEKLMARIILASSRPGEVVLDPLLGSGTTSVVAKKLDRRYVGIEIDPAYSCLAEKRLATAERFPGIQGYDDGVFWERNSRRRRNRTATEASQARLWGSAR